jgi:RNA polymerase sigma factor (TIGR02999 family)
MSRLLTLPGRLFATIIAFMSDVTEILSRIERGDASATDQLLPLVYEELRKLAKNRMAGERLDHTLQATALVHEAFVRLVDTESSQKWESRGHFFSAAAEAMRRILVDHARRKARPKHGGGRKRLPITESCLSLEADSFDDLLALNEALEKLAAKDARKAELVKLRFFTGLTGRQAAQVLAISESTADLDWAYAKTWLRLEIAGPSADRGPSE